MERPIIRDQQQGRTYDFLSLAREILRDVGFAMTDLLGSNSTVATDLTATATSPASLTISISSGRIYQWAVVDATQYGDLPQDNTYTLQQGIAAAQTLTFSTAGLSAGQSRYALVQAGFTQNDIIPADDPNSGVLAYFNPDNPLNPYTGPGNSGASQATRRSGVCTVSIKYGAAAPTGTEVAPSADAGCVGLYLVDLSYGQTQIAQNQVSKATNAPFFAGILNQHHTGALGQAPKIVLTNGAEVQGVLPNANAPAPSGYLDQIGITRGSLLYRGETGWAIVAPGTVGQVLKANGTGADPTWQDSGVRTWKSATFALGAANSQNFSLPANFAGFSGTAIPQFGLVCTTAEGGWSVGDTIFNPVGSSGTSDGRGYTVGVNSGFTTAYWGRDGNSLYAQSKTGGLFLVTPANWNGFISFTLIG